MKTKYKNSFLKVNSKKCMCNEKLTDLKKWYKSSKYNYTEKQYLRFKFRVKPFNNMFNKKDLRMYNVKDYSLDKNRFMVVY